MTDFNGFRGAARRLEDIDLPRLGHRIGVGEDVVHAVLEVESAGRGFDKLGRPKMLFEPHIFWREFSSGPKRDAAARAGLAYPTWKAGAYPADSYPRLAAAIEIDETAALRSASWGLGQVMGFNHRAAGFGTVQDFVRAMLEDEDRHLEAMIAFIVSRGLDDELRRKDWAGFARGYNGAGYARHGYHTKLAAAYAKWVRIPDTPWDPDAVAKAWEADDTPVYDAAASTSAQDMARPEPAVWPEPKPAPTVPVVKTPEISGPVARPPVQPEPADQAPADSAARKPSTSPAKPQPQPEGERAGPGGAIVAFFIVVVIILSGIAATF